MQMPSVMFMYDMSPISVTIKEIRSSFTHLLVRFCAVVGGVFAVTGTLCFSNLDGHSMSSLLLCMYVCFCAAVRELYVF